MKVKASISLSSEILRAVDKLARDGRTRSSIIEEAIRSYLLQARRARRDARDLALLNEHADVLNAEMDGILRDQVDL